VVEIRGLIARVRLYNQGGDRGLPQQVSAEAREPMSAGSSTSRTSAVAAETSAPVRRRGARPTATPSSSLHLACPEPSVFAKIPYHPIEDFAPVTLAVGSATVLSVNPSLPARTVKDLVALINANPGKYNIASPGAGTTTHLTGEQFRTSLALDVAQVPFGGAGPAIASVIAGHTQIIFSAVASAAAQIKAGQLRPLAATGKTRSAMLPDVPTTAEAGYPHIEGDGWVGVLVPAGTPNEIISSLHREMVRIIALPDVKERLPTLGFEPIGSTPEEFDAQIKAEIDKWAKIVRDANVKTQ
jgi:tripartite-type tricarboxylate transporter receptor subunit TctC